MFTADVLTDINLRDYILESVCHYALRNDENEIKHRTQRYCCNNVIYELYATICGLLNGSQHNKAVFVNTAVFRKPIVPDTKFVIQPTERFAQ